MFSTLRPAAPPEGAIRLSAFSSLWLSILAFGLVAGGGVALMFTRFGMRLLAIGAALVLVVLSGIFLPTFSHQVCNGLTMAAGFVVLVLWGLWYVLVTRPRDPLVTIRREAREARAKASRDAAVVAAKESAARAAKWAEKGAKDAKDPSKSYAPLVGETPPPFAEEVPPPSPGQKKSEGGEPHA